MRFLLGLLASCAVLWGIGGASGAALTYQKQGSIGEVVVNPYGVAPLTAVIKNGGYTLLNASVEISPKPKPDGSLGVGISYDLDATSLRTHGGIAVFGLYADYVNSVKVRYTREFAGKTEQVSETYQIYAAPVFAQVFGATKGVFFSKIEVVKVAPQHANRLYLINNIGGDAKGMKVVWNNPTGGALEWNYQPQIFIIDTAGEVRWYLHTEPFYEMDSIYKSGVMMGFRQSEDGALMFGYGQRYAKFDILGREIFNRRLPLSYNDFSHSLFATSGKNGASHTFLRVANANYKREDGRNVRTVRDVIVELDENANAVDDWRLYEILDPYRSDVLKTLDQGAVCLNIDAKLSGKTLSSQELAKLDVSEKFGDIVGSGAGRNWAHVNSVFYDEDDDSIIISSRHQSAVVKIARDKSVKWILSSPQGWSEKFKDKLLTPVDANGKKIKCTHQGSVCEGGFDWTWTQHTAFKIQERSRDGELWLSVFDNGDGRGMSKPLYATSRYSRAVIYKINEKKRTIQQVWQSGKERGNAWFSPVTSIVEFIPNASVKASARGKKTCKGTDSVLVYSATAGMTFDISSGMPFGTPKPVLSEFLWDCSAQSPRKESATEIILHDAMGYQAMPFDLNKAF